MSMSPAAPTRRTRRAAGVLVGAAATLALLVGLAAAQPAPGAETGGQGAELTSADDAAAPAPLAVERRIGGEDRLRSASVRCRTSPCVAAALADSSGSSHTRALLGAGAMIAAGALVAVDGARRRSDVVAASSPSSSAG